MRETPKKELGYFREAKLQRPREEPKGMEKPRASFGFV